MYSQLRLSVAGIWCTTGHLNNCCSELQNYFVHSQCIHRRNKPDASIHSRLYIEFLYVISKLIQHPSSAGGPFCWVSCPHYLAEIIIYTGLAILAGNELPLTLLILCWVVSVIYTWAIEFIQLAILDLNSSKLQQLDMMFLQVTNLLLAAQPTHLWYQQHFADYPRNRRALIPYLY